MSMNAKYEVSISYMYVSNAMAKVKGFPQTGQKLDALKFISKTSLKET